MRLSGSADRTVNDFTKSIKYQVPLKFQSGSGMMTLVSKYQNIVDRDVVAVSIYFNRCDLRALAALPLGVASRTP